MSNRALFGLLAVLFAAASHGQIKHEREFRIKESEVPKGAIEFLHAAQLDTHTRWYKEISQDGVTVEAKFKLDGRGCSVEFDTTGNVQDIEIFRQWDELPEGARKNITAHMESLFNSYRIEKIQEQFTGARDSLVTALRDPAAIQGFTTRYEVEVRARKEHEYIAYEILYDEDGNPIRKSEIVTRGTDNLEY